MNIKGILNDWKDGLTHDEILEMMANGQVYLGEVGNEELEE